MNAFWFKPKEFGYGATPTTWEGWTVTAVYVLVVLACVIAMMIRKGSFSMMVWSMAVIAVSTMILIVVSVQKTDGAWSWNAGSKSDSKTSAGKSER